MRSYSKNEYFRPGVGGAIVAPCDGGGDPRLPDLREQMHLEELRVRRVFRNEQGAHSQRQGREGQPPSDPSVKSTSAPAHVM